MNRRSLLSLGTLAWLGALASPALADDGLVIIANAPIKGLDTELLKRIYTGRTIELDGQSLWPANQTSGQVLRQRFLRSVLQQDDEDYQAYWTVRRYIGKGAPPRELRSSAEVIDYVRRTPGALGYIDASELRPGLTVVMRR